MYKTIRVLMAALLLGAGGVEAADPPAPDLAARIELARQRLDAAAREFADLHGELAAESGAGTGPEFAGTAISIRNVAFEGRGMLGIVLGPPQDDGVRVIGVTPGSGAEAAGLKAGDIVLAVGGTPVGSVRDLHHSLAAPAPGDVVTVEFQRGDDRQSVDVTVSEPRPFEVQLPVPDGMPLGAVTTATAAGPTFFRADVHALQLHDVDANLGRYFGVSSGVLVLQADAESGLEAGDILVSVGEVTVRDAADAFGRLFGRRDGSSVTVLRDGAERTVDFVPGPFPPLGDRLIRPGPGSVQGVQVFRSE